MGAAMTDRELMQQALYALEGYARNCRCEGGGAPCDAAEALRARLAQPEHKPADVFLFLLGEGELDGAKFGERHPTERGNYWWRKHLRAVLAQPEPEPVACPYCHYSHTLGAVFFDQNCAGCVNRMTTPPQRGWQGLTENEIKHLWYEACQTNLELTSQLIVHLARNIEAKLKEKNG
jgi:hypothetical protein